MTRYLARHIAFTAAFTDIGMPVQSASEVAQKYAEGKTTAQWAVYDPVGKGKPTEFRDRGANASIHMLFDVFSRTVISEDDSARRTFAATRLGVVHLAAVYERIDALFDGPANR